MASAIALREDFSAVDLRALARESRDSRQCRRLLALAAVADGRSRGEAAVQDILDAACEAWNHLIDQPWRIMSIGLRKWAHNGQTL